MAKRKPTCGTNDPAADISRRASDYCRTGEEAAFYLSGLADGLEAAGESFKGSVHHLRHHARELQMGTMWVEHGYKDNGDTRHD